MLVVEPELRVAASAGFQSSEFRVRVDAKLYRLLSDGLYSDKIKAVVRELSTNAGDGLIAAGKPDEPFLVHLPTVSEPYFSVRDHGIGLSPEQLTTVYTTYLESDKSGSNAYTGAFGLGAKSPLAYTESFQVTSWTDGMQRVYTVYRSEDGIPVLALLAENPSDAPVGVEVRVPVLSGDIVRFREAAAKVYPFFRIPPRGCSSSTVTARPSYRLRGDTAGLVVGYGDAYKHLVVMGDVAYPLDLDQLKSQLAGETGTKFELPASFQVNAWYHHLYVPLGSVAITPSRESLAYTPVTIRFLREAVLRAHRELGELAYGHFDELPTYWEACLRFNEFYELKAYLTGRPAPTWRGRPVVNQLTFQPLKTLRGAPAQPEVHQTGFLPAGVSAECITIRKAERKGASGLVCDWRAQDVMRIHPGVVAFFLNDLPGSGRFATARRWLTQHHVGRMVEGVILPPEALTPEYIADLGIADKVVRLSQVPRPPVERRPRPRQERTRLRRLWHDSFSATPCETPSAGGVYVEICRETVYTRRLASQSAERLLVEPRVVWNDACNLRVLLGQELSVYGIRTADLPRLLKQGGWVQFDDFVRRTLKRQRARWHRKASLQLARSEQPEPSRILELTAFRYRADSVFGAYARVLREASLTTNNAKLNAFLTLCGRYEDTDFPSLVPPPSPEYLAAATAMRQRYPMLGAGCYGSKAAYKQYIDLLDVEESLRAAGRGLTRDVKVRPKSSRRHAGERRSPRRRRVCEAVGVA